MNFETAVKALFSPFNYAISGLFIGIWTIRYLIKVFSKGFIEDIFLPNDQRRWMRFVRYLFTGVMLFLAAIFYGALYNIYVMKFQKLNMILISIAAIAFMITIFFTGIFHLYLWRKRKKDQLFVAAEKLTNFYLNCSLTNLFTGYFLYMVSSFGILDNIFKQFNIYSLIIFILVMIFGPAIYIYSILEITLLHKGKKKRVVWTNHDKFGRLFFLYTINEKRYLFGDEATELGSKKFFFYDVEKGEFHEIHFESEYLPFKNGKLVMPTEPAQLEMDI